ncbi:MAG: phosphate acyltransferase, partial [Wenzhouxiangella sp.]
MPDSRALTVAVDAMGGDDGIETAVGGAIAALKQDRGLELDLVGDREQLERRFASVDSSLRSRLSVVAADSVLPMDVDTASALRRGRGSSMYETLDRVANGQADAAVSAGNTGALMALSRQLLGMLPGIERPALMAAIPAAGHSVWVLDLGAN